MSDRDRLVSATGRTQVERVRYTQVKIEDAGGETVTVRDEMHAKANFYIRQSRPYFPNKKLRAYIDCSNFLRAARVLCGASLFGALAAVGGGKGIPVFFLAACLLFFLFYCQHQWVNQKSLPVVFKQPVFLRQEHNNSFYEVTVTELDGVALQNYQSGIGFIELSRGKIQFQAFNAQAMKFLSDAKYHSRLMFLLFAMASGYNLYFVLAYSIAD